MIRLAICLIMLSAYQLADAATNTNAVLLNSELSQGEIETQLRILEKELSKYQAELDTSKDQKIAVEASLRRDERNINTAHKNILVIEEDLKDNRRRLSNLQSRQDELNHQKTKHQRLIEQQIRAAYEMGNQEYLKIILNQEDPQYVARMMTYYDYFNEARANQIADYNQLLLELGKVTADLNSAADSLASNRKRLREERAVLVTLKQQKQKSLNDLLNKIRSTGSEINRLEGDREHLEQLLSRIVNRLSDIPETFSEAPFEGMQGQLMLPVSGQIKASFGETRNVGKLKWSGMLIEADSGEPVYAIHHGRVVFSDWLRGFGLLLIINHGNGYMSLYGHNQTLYLNTGDSVTGGDLISTVGDSGGQTQSGLYFEIRINGTPTNPMRWCIVRKQGAA